jgi:hypothetical protein
MKNLFRNLRRNLLETSNLDRDRFLYISGELLAMSQLVAMSGFKRLSDAEFKVFSQWGEDGILNYIFNVLDFAKPKIMEIGAANFQECNSRFAAESRNSSVYAVDMNPALVDEVKKWIYFGKIIFFQYKI